MIYFSHFPAPTTALRFSCKYPTHVSLLIDMGFSAGAIGNRVGHESSDITYRYAHMMPSIQDDMAEALDEEWM